MEGLGTYLKGENIRRNKEMLRRVKSQTEVKNQTEANRIPNLFTSLLEGLIFDHLIAEIFQAVVLLEKKNSKGDIHK